MGWTWRVDLATFFGFIARNLEKNMSDTDIYKGREQDRTAPPAPNPGRRRRRSNRQLFDDTGDRKRRRKNSGFRRLLHLSRKGENEKRFWWGLLVVVAVALSLIGIWQFWYREQVAREQAKQNEMYVPLQSLQQPDSATE